MRWGAQRAILETDTKEEAMATARATWKASILDRTTVGEAMHVGVISCHLETPLTEVARLMAEHRIHCVVGFGDVADDDTRLWGVITDADLMAVAAGADPADYTAGAAAATEAVTIRAHESLRRAAGLLREHQVSHLLVAGPTSDRPVGVISGLDIARVIGGGETTKHPAGSRVDALMSSPAVAVSPETPLRELARLLAERGISGVPVVQDGTVVGVVSEADIVAKEQATGVPKRASHPLARRRRAVDARLRKATTVGEVMTTPAITIAAWRPASAAAALMVEHGVKRLPVVRNDRLIGIVTRSDLVRAFARSDEELERDVRTVIHHAAWADPESIAVSVRDGKATLRGLVDTELSAELLELALERLPGILEVDARLSTRDR
jgi:CBS domain-containing protein